MVTIRPVLLAPRCHRCILTPRSRPNPDHIEEATLRVDDPAAQKYLIGPLRTGLRSLTTESCQPEHTGLDGPRRAHCFARHFGDSKQTVQRFRPWIFLSRRSRPARVRPETARGWSQEDKFSHTESLILAQDERWRRALHMQVVRERGNQLAGDPR